MNARSSIVEVDIIGNATPAIEIIAALARRGCPDLTPSLDLARCGAHPATGGGFCDVYRGYLDDGTKIAIKCLRIYDQPGKEEVNENSPILKRTARELYHWSKLKHSNVLPLMGLAIFRGHMSMISEWVDHGDLMSYVQRNQSVNRISLCMDVCEGLLYIHGNNMVHGDLKAANVMVSREGTAMIADFGNSQLKDLTLRFANTSNTSFSVRWAAPELLLAEAIPQLTTEMDIYAYGMTILEALTGKIPFAQLGEIQVMRAVSLQCKTPTRPETNMNDGLWEIMRYCWTWEASKRPNISNIWERMRALSSPSQPPSRKTMVQWTKISPEPDIRIPYAPYHLSKTLLNSSILEDYVLAHWDRTAESVYFKPSVQMPLDGLRSMVVSRLQESNFARWTMFIIAKVYDSLTEGDTSQSHKYEHWINQIDQAFKTVSAHDPDVNEIRRHYGYWLQVLLIKMFVSRNSSAYQLLRYITPLFLQMVHPDLPHWSRDNHPNCVPLVDIVASPRHELSYFTFLDATTAMAFGLPQQLEYNYTLDWDSPPTSYSSCAHCFPAEFQVALAEINACRDHTPRARRWKEIESTLLSWRSRQNEHGVGWESWMSIAWLAVEETWRQMLLAYLYMSVCGVSSDDPRVQSSVRQFLQISETIRGLGSSNQTPALFFQYLMAGICARSEKHRSTVRKHLTNASDTKFWLWRAADFALVLDDLWHGAAVDGLPITWTDYLRSREKVLLVYA